MSDLYTELGVERRANGDAIKKAHRKRVQETHPDVKGGDADKFRRVQHAYLVLSDPERRKRYDETGDEGDASRMRSPEEIEAEEAMQILGAMVAALLNDPSVNDFAIDHTDLARNLRTALGNASTQRVREEMQINGHIKRAEKMARKWKRKRTKKGDGEKPDVIGAMFAAQVAGMRQRLEAIARAERINARVLALLDGYEYEHDPKATPATLGTLGQVTSFQRYP